MSPGLILLDTSIVIHLIRGRSLAEWIEKQFQLRDRPNRPLISVVSFGECLAFARQRNWGTEKVDKLRELLRELVQVDITSEPVLERYARIADHLRRAGHTIEQNDMWIAACAGAVSATLLTSDHDFDQIPPSLLTHEWIDPKSA